MLEHVEATMPDGLRLMGAWHSPPPDIAPLTNAVDGILLVHGTGSNFYGPSMWGGFVPRLLELGVCVLAVNTRGHDGINWAHWSPERREAEPRLPRLLGSAYEVVDHCRWDISGWLDYMRLRGCRRVALVGHSLGGVKIIYSQALEPHATVVGIAALSPPRLSYSYFKQTTRAASFENEYAQATALVDAGEGQTLMEVKFPLPFVISAAGYLDKYGPDERYNLLRFLDRALVPMLFTYGAIEMLWGPAFSGMPEALESFSRRDPPLKVAVIAGADHVYSGTQSDLAAVFARWLRGLPATM